MSPTTTNVVWVAIAVAVATLVTATLGRVPEVVEIIGSGRTFRVTEADDFGPGLTTVFLPLLAALLALRFLPALGQRVSALGARLAVGLGCVGAAVIGSLGIAALAILRPNLSAHGGVDPSAASAVASQLLILGVSGILLLVGSLIGLVFAIRAAEPPAAV